MTSSMFIVEDDDHFRETFIDVMALRGVEVSGARSGDEAIKALRRSAPAVIIMDVNLPDVHGFDLCRRVKRLAGCEDIPVIFVSASGKYADPRDRAAVAEAGGERFIQKPVSVEALWSEIEAVLGRRSSPN